MWKKNLDLLRYFISAIVTNQSLLCYLSGIVVGGPDERPVEYCDIVVNGSVVAFSDFDGTFEIPVAKSAKRLVATFRDYMEEYEESTVVLPFRKGTTTFHKIHLRLEVVPIEFDPEVEKAVPIASDEVAEVIIPANSLIDKDGNPKKGKAKVKIQFNDPRNEREILESPGEFSTVDEDGEEQLLRTYGIFKVKIQDENNQNLGLTKNLHLNIDIEQLTGENFDDSEPFPHLWWLDEKTGRWVDAGELKRNEKLGKRRKRQLRLRGFSGEIEGDRVLNAYNVDIRSDQCFAKVKANGQGDAGIEGAKITSISVNLQGEVQQGYRTGLTDSDGYICIATQCNSDGYLEVEKEGLPLLPDQREVALLPPEVGASVVDNRRIKFIPGEQPNSGPVYQLNQEGTCKEKDQRFFSFDRKDNKPNFDQEYSQANVLPKHKNLYRGLSRVRRCFVKIVTSGTTETLVMAESFSSDGRDEKLGEAIKETEKVDNLYAACLEYLCSSKEGTFIRLTVLTGECQRSKVQESLDARKNIATNVATVLIPKYGSIIGSKIGIFVWLRGLGKTLEQIKSTCVDSAIDENAYRGFDFTGFAVKFNCA